MSNDTAEPVTFPSVEKPAHSAGDNLAETLRNAAAALEAKPNPDAKDRALAALLRSCSLRTAKQFVLADHDGTVRTCCDAATPCDAHTACLSLATALLP